MISLAPALPRHGSRGCLADALSTTGGVRDRRGKTKICGLVERERVGYTEFARYRKKKNKAIYPPDPGEEGDGVDWDTLLC